MLPAFDLSPDSFVVSVKFKLLSLRKSRVPPPKALTNKSKSPSPSISANAAAVESCPKQDTFEISVTSENFQPPRFRYNLLPFSNPQK